MLKPLRLHKCVVPGSITVTPLVTDCLANRREKQVPVTVNLRTRLLLTESHDGCPDDGCKLGCAQNARHCLKVKPC